MSINRSIAVIPLIAALMLCGCTGGDPAKKSSESHVSFSTASGDATKEMTISVGTEDDIPVLNQITENFKKKNPDFPYTIKPVVISEADVKNKVLTNINGAPDVFTFADDQLNALAASGILEKVGDKSAANDNIKAAVEAASVDGKLYAYPMTADNGYIMYYNKKFFDDSDLTSLDKMMKKAASKGKKITMDLTSGWYLYSFYGETGLKLGLADDGLTNVCDWNSTKNSPSGLDVADAIYKVASNPGFLSGGDDVLTAGAKDGSVVAGVSGVWLSTNLAAAWGDDLGAVKLPTYTVAGKQVQMASYAGYKMVGVNSFSSKKEWGNKFAAFMTNEESQTLRFQKRGQGPSNKKASESSDVKASPAIQALLSQSSNSSLQRVGQKYWDPAFAFGSELVSGKKPDQKWIDQMVKQINASVID